MVAGFVAHFSFLSPQNCVNRKVEKCLSYKDPSKIKEICTSPGRYFEKNLPSVLMILNKNVCATNSKSICKVFLQMCSQATISRRFQNESSNHVFANPSPLLLQLPINVFIHKPDRTDKQFIFCLSVFHVYFRLSSGLFMLF